MSPPNMFVVIIRMLTLMCHVANTMIHSMNIVICKHEFVLPSPFSFSCMLFLKHGAFHKFSFFFVALQVQERLAQLAAARTAEVYAQYTFKPHISERSLRITEDLGTSFFVRQQKHMERRQKVVCGVSGMCVVCLCVCVCVCVFVCVMCVVCECVVCVCVRKCVCVCVCVNVTEIYSYTQLFDLYHQMDEAYQLPARQLSRSRKMVKLVPRVPPPPNTKDTPPTKGNQLY